MTPQEIRSRRMSFGIPGRVVCARAGIGRSRLSELERGLVHPRPDEVVRLTQAIEHLAAAKTRLREVAGQLGWPGGVV